MKVGDCCDITELLATAERDFLIRNNGDRVKVDSLRGKIVGILFVVLREKYKNKKYADNIVEVYNELSPKGDFEVIFVAAAEGGGVEDGVKDKELFEKNFSKMPWLAIPFFDLETRNRVSKLFSMPSSFESMCSILDSSGKVLEIWADYNFQHYGMEWYPFTHERLEEIHEEDAAVRKEMSLKTLLASPSRDFVISNKGVKVPIAELEGKVVGLYMYDCERIDTKKLVEIYEKLIERGENFEIVLIFLHFYGDHDDGKSFEQTFERMPWLALPFMDKSCRKLWRIFDYPGVGYTDEGSLVMIGPGGNFVDPHGVTIVEEYGIEGYPFTQEKAIEIERDRLKAVTLESLFVAANQDFVIQRDGAKIPVSDLIGTSIHLFFASKWCRPYREVVPKLIQWYNEIKEKDETFEVIYVSSDDCQASFDEFFTKMPWLAFPYEARHVHSLFHEILGCNSTALVAFGSDGHVLTKQAMRRLEIHGADAYPFTDDKLLKEIHEELGFKHSWILTDEEGNPYRPI